MKAGRLITRLSSSRRIALITSAEVLVALVAVGLVAVLSLRSHLIGRVDDELLSASRSAAAALAVLDAGQLEELSRPTNLAPRTSALVILDAAGNIQAELPATGAISAPELPPFSVLEGRARPFTTDIGGDHRLLARPLAGDRLIVLAAPLEPVYETVRAVGRTIAIVAAIALGLYVLLVAVVIHAANRQVDALIDTAGRIGTGDFTARVEDAPPGTEAARLSSALNDMLARLEEAFAAKDASESRLRRFAADASHELRTPLTTIRGYAELVQSGATPTSEATTAAMVRIQAEADRMAKLVGNLLSLARLDQRQELVRAPVDLGSIVRESVADARAVDPGRPLALVTQEGGSPVMVDGDADSLRQVVANLLANVRSHTPADTPARVGLEVAGESAVLTVADDGPGMPVADAAQAFERFHRAELARSQSSQGSGLGLAIVEAVVTAHGGSASLSAQPGQGTTVTITLPLLGQVRG